mgnify:CR=1 FL=1
MVKTLEIGLIELIQKVKQELAAKQDDDELFFIEEINLEVNFVVSGDLNSGFNLGIVTVGSDVNEQKTQKINVKLTPILTKDELKKKISPENMKRISSSSSESLFKSGGQVK